jgi:hypothetical protein
MQARGDVLCDLRNNAAADVRVACAALCRFLIVVDGTLGSLLDAIAAGTPVAAALERTRCGLEYAAKVANVVKFGWDCGTGIFSHAQLCAVITSAVAGLS